MVAGTRWNGVGFSACLLDRVQGLLPTIADTDIEPSGVDPDIAPHDPGQLDIPNFVVDHIGPLDPGLLHLNATGRRLSLNGVASSNHSGQEMGKLDDFKRYPLLFGPSPVHPLRRLSAFLGGDVAIWAKREDCNSGIA